MVTHLAFYTGRLATWSRNFLPHGLGLLAPGVGQDASLVIIWEMTPDKLMKKKLKNKLLWRLIP